MSYNVVCTHSFHIEIIFFSPSTLIFLFYNSGFFFFFLSVKNVFLLLSYRKC